MTIDLCAATPEADASAPAGGVTGSVHSWDISTGVDGPGTRFVLFTAGCPLACAYCHNPDTQDMRYGTRHSVDDVLARIGRYRRFIAASGGGVTVSGGEPLLQPAFTSAVLQGAKDLGLHTALDTSGALGHRADDSLLAATDLVLLDVKAIDPAIYADLTRGSLTPTLRFAERLATLGNVERVDVLGYHRLGREKYAELGMVDRLAGVDGATAAQVQAAREVFTAAGLVAP